MLIQPVIERELRVQSRDRTTYWTRVVAVAILSIIFYGAVAVAAATGSRLGQPLFVSLHIGISVILAFTCSLMTADTLARERREGTLGLLRLTPLKPGAVVAGKISVHLFRAFALWLAIVPVLLLPLLTGGVGAGDIALALSCEASLAFIGLAAGLLASCLADRWGAGVFLSLVFTVMLAEAVTLSVHLVFAAFVTAKSGHWQGINSVQVGYLGSGRQLQFATSNALGGPWRFLLGLAVRELSQRLFPSEFGCAPFCNLNSTLCI